MAPTVARGYTLIWTDNDTTDPGLHAAFRLDSTGDRIALAVDAAPEVIEAAAAWDADMLLVHHGILWRNVERIAGPLGRRLPIRGHWSRNAIEPVYVVAIAILPLVAAVLLVLLGYWLFIRMK